MLPGVASRFVSGESYVLTGDNGSGKSTLMRIVAGLEDADTGTLEIDGRTAHLRGYPEGCAARSSTFTSIRISFTRASPRTSASG